MATPPHSLFARVYDMFMVPQDRFGLRHQRQQLCRDAAGKVLEVAIGTGLNIPHYERAELVIGIDNHRGMLHRAIRRTWESIIPVRLVAADARKLPFPDDYFDTVVIGFSLCTIPDPDAALEEFSRVVAPAGTLHFLEHVHSNGATASSLQNRFAGVWEKISGGCRLNQDTESLLAASPWSIDQIWASDSGGLIQGTARLS